MSAICTWIMREKLTQSAVDRTLDSRMNIVPLSTRLAIVCERMSFIIESRLHLY